MRVNALRRLPSSSFRMVAAVARSTSASSAGRCSSSGVDAWLGAPAEAGRGHLLQRHRPAVERLRGPTSTRDAPSTCSARGAVGAGKARIGESEPRYITARHREEHRQPRSAMARRHSRSTFRSARGLPGESREHRVNSPCVEPPPASRKPGTRVTPGCRAQVESTAKWPFPDTAVRSPAARALRACRQGPVNRGRACPRPSTPSSSTRTRHRRAHASPPEGSRRGR